jgi:hypothetical protein
MRVVSISSASVIAGRIVVSRRSSIDLPAPGGPGRSPDLGQNAGIRFSMTLPSKGDKAHRQ